MTRAVQKFFPGDRVVFHMPGVGWRTGVVTSATKEDEGLAAFPGWWVTGSDFEVGVASSDLKLGSVAREPNPALVSDLDDGEDDAEFHANLVVLTGGL